jgi:hypothetical protein
VDSNLREAWETEMGKYPGLVKDVLTVALNRAHDVKHNPRQTAVRDAVIERIGELLQPGDEVDDDAIQTIMDWKYPE